MNDDPRRNDRPTGPSTIDDAAARAVELLREALDIGVGLGIMAVNRVQSVRREVAGDRPTPPTDDDEAPAPKGPNSR